MENKQSFGAQLRELRKSASLTLRELAEKVNVNFTYLSKIESGTLPPPSEKVIRHLAEALNFDKDELLALAGIIPSDIAEILKDRKAREKLRAEQAKRSRSTGIKMPDLPKVSLPLKGLYRLALPVFLVIAVAFSVWYASPTQALIIEYPNQPSAGTLGSTYTFTVKVSIEDYEHLPLEKIDIEIYNVANPTTYKATLAILPLGDQAATSHPPSEGSASGTATVAAAAEGHWGYSTATGNVTWESTGYSFTPSPSGGYGYQGGTGTTYITYTIVWTPPSTGWPEGAYEINTILTTSTQSPGSGTTFTKTSDSFTLSAPVAAAVVGGGGGGAVTSEGTTFLYGAVDSQGKFVQDITAKSADKKVELDIDRGVIGKTKTGQRLTKITVNSMTIPPAPPAQSSTLGLTYDLGPDGATFNPSITITFTYDPASIPEGVDEADLSLAYYDSSTGEWVVLEGIVVDPVNNTISGQVSHFTAFAIIAYEPIVAPEPEPEPTPPAPAPEPEPTPPAPAPEPEPTPPAPAPAPEPTPPAPEPEPAPPAPAPAPEPEEGVNWWLIGGIIAVVIIVAIVVWLLVFRRRYA